MKKTKLNFFLLFIILCLFIKTDYRLETGIYCCKDDYDYYAHAETIAIDFDFDYSNQLEGYEEKRFFYNGKSAPSTFFGTGLLSSPFLFIGNLIDRVIPNNSLFNFKIILYSFSSIFYFAFSLVLVDKINVLFGSKYNSVYLFIITCGSGVVYYAFERYSMSHVYEVFSILLLIYFCIKYYLDKGSNQLAFTIPILVMLAIMTRWVNIYIFIVPFIISKMINNSQHKLRNSKYFWLGSSISFILFLVHTYLIFGVVTINPEFTYNTSGTIASYINSDDSFFYFIINNIKNLFLLLFGPEFGLIWFSPIIFSGFYFSVKNIIFNSKERALFIITLFCFLQVFGLVLIWKSAGSSYGFRYTMNLTPLAILIFVSQKNTKSFELNYLKIMSIFSIFSVLYFETTKYTQLSTEYIINMFGKNTKFTRPDYLIGYLRSVIEFEAYLKIFAQSFLGFVVFYLLIYFFEAGEFYLLLDRFSLPYNNPDFINLINKIEYIELYKVLISMLLVFTTTLLIFNNASIKKNK